MIFSLLTRLRDIPLTFVDVETTGASVDWGDRIIEIGVARIEGGRVVAEFQQLVDPGRPISPGVVALTGITNGMVAGRPTFGAITARVLELFTGAAIIGHNVPFDLSFLRREFRRARVDLPAVLGDVPVLDTVRIARRRWGRGGNALQVLSRRLGIVPSVAHRALADVQTTLGVFEKLIEPIGGWDLKLVDALMAQGGTMGLVPANPRQSLLPLELEEALDLGLPVQMEYLDANDVRTIRIVQPHKIRRIKGELMLVAYCEMRQAKRTFRVDRIVHLTRIDHPVVGPDACGDLFSVIPPTAPPPLGVPVEPSPGTPDDPTSGSSSLDNAEGTT